MVASTIEQGQLAAWPFFFSPGGGDVLVGWLVGCFDGLRMGCNDA